MALAAGIVFGLPAITTTKEERAAAERSAVAKRRAERQAQLQAEVRLLKGRGTPARGLEGAAAITARHALAGDLAAAVQQDAAARAQSGEFTQSSTASSASGSRAPWTAPTRRTTSPAAAGATRAWRSPPSAEGRGQPGQQHRLSVSRARRLPSGRFAYCKVSGRPGEGSLVRKFRVHVPTACGGAG